MIKRILILLSLQLLLLLLLLIIANKVLITVTKILCTYINLIISTLTIAAVHVDFTLPAGRKTYQVGENKRRLEVCLTLANVGSYSTDHSLAESVTVKLATSSRLAAKRATTHAAGTNLSGVISNHFCLDMQNMILHTVLVSIHSSTNTRTATANADYTPLSTTLLFPAGSHKWDKNCVNISITDNDLEESVKSFFIDAVIMSPSNGTFGGAAKSNKGSIEVVIIDDEGRGNNGKYEQKLYCWKYVLEHLLYFTSKNIII